MRASRLSIASTFLTVALSAQSEEIDWGQCPEYKDLKSAQSQLPANQGILDLIKKIKPGGNYTRQSPSLDILKKESIEKLVNASPDSFSVGNSMCSSATYLVYLAYLKSKGVDIAHYTANGEQFGRGNWGHWNANGPGTATQFAKTGTGQSFTDIGNAQAGDFAKIIWKQPDPKNKTGPKVTLLGAEERGHSVIFLGCKGDSVCFWSSNTKSKAARPLDDSEAGGIGVRCSTKKDVGYLVFSRVSENPQDHIEGLDRLANSSSPLYKDENLIAYEKQKTLRGSEAISREIAPLLNPASGEASSPPKSHK